jgi:hypothetical protein
MSGRSGDRGLRWKRAAHSFSCWIPHASTCSLFRGILLLSGRGRAPSNIQMPFYPECDGTVFDGSPLTTVRFYFSDFFLFLFFAWAGFV